MPHQPAALPRSTRLTTGLAAGVALAALMLMPLAASAQEATETDLPPGFAAFDSDGDGVITAEEWAEGLESLPPRLRAALGAEDDRLERRAAAMIRLFDADGDGLLSAEELVSGMAALQELRGGMRPGMARGPERRMGWADRGPQQRMDGRADRPRWQDGARPRDGSRWQQGTAPRDGSRWQNRDRLADDPRQRARRAPFGPGGMTEAFDRLDTDGDGVISRAEWDAAMERWTGRSGTPRRSD